MKKIILLSEDANICGQIESGLKEHYAVTCFDNASKILEIIEKGKPDVLVIDNDIKHLSGLDAYRKIKRRARKIKSIMLAGKGDINSAVLAGKAGISDFIPKPVEINRLKDSIESILVPQIIKKSHVLSCENTEWLKGTGEKVRKFIDELEKTSQSEDDIILTSGNGIYAVECAQIIHEIGNNKNRRFIGIDLSSFEKESSEPHFWAAMQELAAENFEGEKSEKEIAGTVCLNKFESISDHFQKSIIKYLSSRDASSIDRNIKFILIASGDNDIFKSAGSDISKGFFKISIPFLNDRKEDIPLIIGAYLVKFCAKYNKNIKGVSSDAMDLFMFYDWPGNYRELECIMNVSTLKCSGDFIDIQDIPIDLQMFVSSFLKKIAGERDTSLSNSKTKMKKELIRIILKYADNDADRAATYLDIPKTAINKDLII